MTKHQTPLRLHDELVPMLSAGLTPRQSTPAHQPLAVSLWKAEHIAVTQEGQLQRHGVGAQNPRTRLGCAKCSMTEALPWGRTEGGLGSSARGDPLLCSKGRRSQEAAMSDHCNHRQNAKLPEPPLLPMPPDPRPPRL